MNRRRHILLNLKRNRFRLFESIQDYAHNAGWSIEFVRETPLNWYGDGAIIDYIVPGELELLLNPDSIPVVTRHTTSTKSNICSVLGSIEENSLLAYNFFRSRGHRNFAGINPTEFDIDPITAFKKIVLNRGFGFHRLLWEDELPENKKHDFKETIKLIRTFLRNLPKPCALQVGSIERVHLVYRAAEEEEINIPREIAVLANTDDPKFGENTFPPTTVIAGELESTGIKMCQLLDNMMQGKKTLKSPFYVPAGKIIPRKSTDSFAVEHPATNKAIEMICDRLDDQLLDINSIAREIGISPKTLQRNFTKYLNLKPNVFIRKMRLEKACEFLEQTKLSLNAIAEKVGYGSNMALSLAFKKNLGITPGHYRKLHALENIS